MKFTLAILLGTLAITLSDIGLAQRAPCAPQPPWSQPVIPDGSFASRTEMFRSQQAVLAYVRDIEHWNDCNENISGLQSGRLLIRARQTAQAYNTALHKYLARSNGTRQQHSSASPARPRSAPAETGPTDIPPS